MFCTFITYNRSQTAYELSRVSLATLTLRIFTLLVVDIGY